MNKEISIDDKKFSPKRKVNNKSSKFIHHIIGSFYSYKMKRVVEYESLGELDVILKMTFYELFKKFFYNIDNSIEKYKSILRNEYINDKRKFCSSCLREYGIYKLIWQVKEVEICSIHMTQLQSKCCNCNTEQPYTSNALARFVCYKCGSDLSKQIELKMTDKNYIEEQLSIINDWLFLLNEKVTLTNYFQEDNNEKYLTLLALFICQGKEKVFNRSKVLFLDSGEITGYIRLIDGQSSGRSISLSRILKIARSNNINLQTFFNVQAPKSYLNSIKSYYSKNCIETLGNCLAPWCKSFGSNKAILMIKNAKFYRYHYMSCICTDCMNKYGYNSSNHEWENMDGLIDLLNAKLLPNLKKRVALSNISKGYKLDWYKLSNAIGYACRYKLLDRQLLVKYTPSSIPNNIVECFEFLYSIGGSMRDNAKKYYEWNISQFYYYLHIKEVQQYLLFEKSMFLKKFYKNNYNKEDLKKKLKTLLQSYLDNNKNINIENIEKDLNCSYSTIYRYKLESITRKALSKQYKIRKIRKKKLEITQVIEYFSQRPLGEELIKGNDIYDTLKLKKGCIDKEVSNLISSKVKEYNNAVKNKKVNEVKIKMDEVVHHLFDLNESVNKDKVAGLLGISKTYLSKNPSLLEEFHKSVTRYYY